MFFTLRIERAPIKGLGHGRGLDAARRAEMGIGLRAESSRQIAGICHARRACVLGMGFGTGRREFGATQRAIKVIAHQVAVMQSGQVVAPGPKDQVLGEELHPYVHERLRAVPQRDASWLDQVVAARHQSEER